MLKPVRKLLRKQRRHARRNRARREIRNLPSCGIPQAEALCEAVSETLSDTLTSEERSAIDAIEMRRAELLASDRPIEIIDYGAGDSSDMRTEAEMEQGVSATLSLREVCSASKEPFWALLLFKLVRKLKPQVAVELGTCVGISASYQAVAQRLNGTGRLVTLEGCPPVAEIAEETLETLGLDQALVVVGPFHETYGKTLADSAPVDYLFIDGHHDRDATIRYYEQALPFLHAHALLVFDDIAWNEGMKEAWGRIGDAPNVLLWLDLGPVGIAVHSAEPGATKKFRIPL